LEVVEAHRSSGFWLLGKMMSRVYRKPPVIVVGFGVGIDAALIAGWK
jgi:hypothetical protein